VDIYIVIGIISVLVIVTKISLHSSTKPHPHCHRQRAKKLCASKDMQTDK